MKRHSHMNELFLSPSFHQIHHGKQPRLCKQEISHQNNQRLQTKNIYSSSYTSLNSYLKEFNLSEKDFFELQQALQTIFHYFKPKLISNDQQLLKQRLISPYLQQKQQQRIDNNDPLLLPLYTNEYFIRNGLLNHNDGPDIYDNNFQSKPMIHLESSSSMNIFSPLILLSNQKYLFNAMTSNFVSDKSRHSHSNTELNMFKYHEKVNDEENETKSMMIRRNKVKIWERENILQQNMLVTYSSIQHDETSDYHRSSIIRTSLTNKNKKISEKSFVENNTSLQMNNENDGNKKSLKIKNIDDLFPMVKILAPYIIIRDSFHLNSNKNSLNSILSMNIDHRNNKKFVEYIDYLTTTFEKRSLTDVLHPRLSTDKHRSLLLPSSFTINQTHPINKKEQVHQRKKNYLLAEFESVLTKISKK